jgi:hypothetical protein
LLYPAELRSQQKSFGTRSRTRTGTHMAASYLVRAVGLEPTT